MVTLKRCTPMFRKNVLLSASSDQKSGKMDVTYPFETLVLFFLLNLIGIASEVCIAIIMRTSSVKLSAQRYLV